MAGRPGRKKRFPIARFCCMGGFARNKERVYLGALMYDSFFGGASPAVMADTTAPEIAVKNVPSAVRDGDYSRVFPPGKSSDIAPEKQEAAV